MMMRFKTKISNGTKKIVQFVFCVCHYVCVCMCVWQGITKKTSCLCHFCVCEFFFRLEILKILGKIIDKLIKKKL